MATFTVTLLVTIPPAPEHESVYVFKANSLPVDCEPDVGFDPVHAPEAVHVSAFAEDHVRVEAPPELTKVSEAEKERVGAGVRRVTGVGDEIVNGASDVS